MKYQINRISHQFGPQNFNSKFWFFFKMLYSKHLNDLRIVLKKCPYVGSQGQGTTGHYYNAHHFSSLYNKTNAVKFYPSSIRQNYHHALKLEQEPSFLECFMTDHGEEELVIKTANFSTIREEIEAKGPICIQTGVIDTTQPEIVETKPTNESEESEGESEDGVLVKIKQPYKLHELEDGPPDEVLLNREMAQKLYQQMQTIRRIETVSDGLYKEKAIRGFCHLYSGQEACAVGIKAVMRPQDNIITAYRCHGWSYLMNISAYGILAELMGRKTGVMRGKGGSMHMYSPHFFGGNGIVGAQVPLGAGIALANKYEGDGGVTITCYGDGAANQGQVFEAFNMASLWKLPCIFVCENNNYGMGTSAARAASNTNYYKRGDVIPGICVDGMDVLAMRSAAKYAIDYALKNGPIIIEANTYRYSGHSMSDPGTSYRSRAEVRNMRANRDPIANFRKTCVENQLMTEDEINDIDEGILQEIDKAVVKARADPEIALDELAADVYANNLEPMIRSQLEFNLPHRQITKMAY